VELTQKFRGSGVGGQLLAPQSRLLAYVTAVSTAGLISVVFVLVSVPWTSTFVPVPSWPIILLAVAAIAGEMQPIRLLRAGAETRTLSTSAPFVLALVAVAGIGVGVLVQGVASVADDLRQHRSLAKSLFNTAQYGLSVIVAGAVYSSLSGTAFFGRPDTVEASDIVPLVIAGIAMIGVNWILVAVVVALSIPVPLKAVLFDDTREFLATNAVLLSVGGIAALIASHGVIALALLAAPVVAAHIFAAAAARHAYSATHDMLTGLGNRVKVQFELTRALESAKENSADGPALVLLDLDHFKDVNDTLGHPVGDQILQQVATRLVAVAPEGATVHRLGGDEFAVVVPGDLTNARQVARELLASFDNAVPVGNLELLVRASVGVAVAPQHGSTGETLMKNADIAMYHAKLERDRISTYSPGFDVNTIDRLKLLGDLRIALDARQLHVVYQPQVDLRSGRTVGVEALVRWKHPQRGQIQPDDFIPLAENSGLIFPLTAYVLDTSLRQLSLWRGAGHDLRVAVNLSARHLSDLGLPDQVSEAAARYGVPLNALILEVTETGILSDPIRADAVIRTLRSRGVEISIDDYGTGNASLSYLKRLEVDELKIDRSFVSNMGNDEQDLIIVRSTIALALALGLRVVAEGIEDGKTTAALSEMGGVIGQGYHLGRPAGSASIDQRLESEASREDPTQGVKA